ncbi:hypothetical protein LCGC14_2086890 [marine sediment metagenome]|uniref:Uncharacterized protein n=1 Tax=marine sediment metagenome TaxID=412755 RepID=A0A0F9F199_9ZZZZ
MTEQEITLRALRIVLHNQAVLAEALNVLLMRDSAARGYPILLRQLTSITLAHQQMDSQALRDAALVQEQL